jgi:2-methylcitrate dehydratase PrpD
MKTISEEIAGWVSHTSYKDLSKEIVAIAKRNILDTIGVTLAASREPVAKIIKRFLKEMEGPEHSTVIGLGIKTSAVETAMANGVIGHYLDYDDLVIPAAGAGGPHISVGILPAALAMAEKNNKTGRELIEAYVLGCEVAYRAGRSIDPSHYNAGWHTTGTENIIGAAVAVSKLLSSSVREIANALGIAASEASGLRENFGTMTKPLHAGQAASKGTKAALLAKFGYTSSRTIFEGRDGYCRVFSKDPKEAEITRDLGTLICLPQIRPKLYPCCGGSHSAIYAMLQLVKKNNLQPGAVDSVNVKGDPQMTVPLVYDDPKTSLEGKFSLQFPLALALTERKVTLPGFTDEKVNDPVIQSLMSKIKLIPVEGLRSQDIHSRAAIVEVNLSNGNLLSERCDYPPGTPRNPIPIEDIIEKYRSCACLILKEREVEQSVDMIMNLENLDNIAKLMSIIK